MKVKYEENLVEISESAIEKIAILLILEPLLASGVYYFATNDQEGKGRYLFVVVLSFFFLALATGLLPLINQIRSNGTKLMVWAVTGIGFLTPARTTTYTTYRPPVVYAWSQVKSILFVNKLIEHDIEGRSVSSNRCVVILADINLQDNWLDRMKQSKSRMEDGTNYLIFSFPKTEKENIIRNIKELAPCSVSIQKFAHYEIK